MRKVAWAPVVWFAVNTVMTVALLLVWQWTQERARLAAFRAAITPHFVTPPPQTA